MAKKLVLYSFVIAAIIFPTTASPAQTQEEILRILNQARSLIDQGRITDALEVLNEASAAAIALTTENLILQEEFLWTTAIQHLDFSYQLTNREQYIEYAKRAYGHWKDYVNWYYCLSIEKRNRLDVLHRRINKATAHLGNSIIRMEEPRLLFSEYSDIPEIEFLGIDAIELWKHWLYACPDMVPVSSNERTSALRQRKICNDQCTEDWLNYASTLADWAKVANLSRRVRERKLLEAEQIKRIAEGCRNR